MALSADSTRLLGKSPTMGDARPVLVDDAGRLETKRTAASSSILNGSATATGTTLITVPANKTWRGTITVGGALRVAAGGVATDGNARVDWTPGAGGTAAFDVRVVLSVPATGGLGGNGEKADGSTTLCDIIIYAGTAAGTLVLNGASLTQYTATAVGVLEDAS